MKILNTEKLTKEQKSDLYDQDSYLFNPPPVCCARWDKSAWIKWIDASGKWIERGVKADAIINNIELGNMD